MSIFWRNNIDTRLQVGADHHGSSVRLVYTNRANQEAEELIGNTHVLEP